MIVNICGIPHKVIECEDNFNVDTHFGQIDYKACEIRINKDMSQESKDETLCHEIVHGIFVHLGYSNYVQDEQLVQSLGNAIYQGFNIKAIEPQESENLDKVLDKIRAEIKHTRDESNTDRPIYDRCLSIIDKYREEQKWRARNKE